MSRPPTTEAAVPTSPLDAPVFDRFLRRSGQTFLALAGSTVANSLFFLLVARRLGPSGAGVVSVGLLLAGVLSLVVSGPLQLANTYFGAGEPRLRPALLSNSLLVILLPGPSLAGATLAALVASGLTFDATTGELATALLSVPFIAGHRLVGAIVLSAGRSTAFNVLTAVGPALALAALVAAFALGRDSALVALGCYTGAHAGLFVLFALSVGIWPARPSWPLFGRTLGYGLKGFVGNLLQLFNYRLDIFLVSTLRGSSATGIYTVAVYLAELLWRIPSAPATILFPRVAAGRHTSPEFTLRVGRVVVAATALGAVALLGAAAWLVPALLGRDFAASVAPLAILLPGVVVLSLVKVLAGDLAGRGAPQYGSYAAALGLAVTVVAGPVLIPMYGAAGAALASSLAYGASTILIAIVFVRRFDVGLLDLLLLRRGDLARTRGPEVARERGR